jgi:hypothetical protein
MKKLLNPCILFIVFLAITACRSNEFDPVNGVRVQLDIQAEVLKSNASKTGEVFERTYTLNLRDTFVKRYNIDPTKLDSFMVNYVSVAFNQDRCKKLQTYELKTTFPIIGPFGVKDLCDFTLIGGKPAAIALGAGQSSPFSNLLSTTNFASSVKNGTPITLDFKMIPKEDFPEGFGVIIILSTRATYRP